MKLIKEYTVVRSAFANNATGAVATVTVTAPLAASGGHARTLHVVPSWYNLTGATAPTVALELVIGATAYRLGNATYYSLGGGSYEVTVMPGQTIRFNITSAGDGTSDAVLFVKEFSHEA